MVLDVLQLHQVIGQHEKTQWMTGMTWMVFFFLDFLGVKKPIIFFGVSKLHVLMVLGKNGYPFWGIKSNLMQGYGNVEGFPENDSALFVQVIQ